MRKALLALFATWASLATSIAATNYTLQWDPVTYPGLAGYKVYQGVASRAYTNWLSVDSGVTNFFLGSPDRSVTHYYAVTAYDTNGIESDYSAEVSLDRIPPATNVVTFAVKLFQSSNVAGPYVLRTNFTMSATNPVGMEFVSNMMAVTITNIAK